jgi:hypothetical protein
LLMTFAAGNFFAIEYSLSLVHYMPQPRQTVTLRFIRVHCAVNK